MLFFARNCNLSFKVNKRAWRSDLGKAHKLGMILLMKTHPSIFDGVKDIYDLEEKKEEMNGVVTEFELIPYEKRVEQWYPLISEINSDDCSEDGTLKYPNRPEGIVVKGISFLRFHFVREVYGNMQYIMPIRDEEELWHKLYISSVEYRNPAQIALKLRMYQFYIYKWPKARATFKRIHDHIMKEFLPNMEGFKDDDVLKRELPRKLGINFEELVASYPTLFDVENFFRPKNGQVPVSKQTDLRNIVLGTDYRVNSHLVCWDLIRRKDYVNDIYGAYPRMLGTEHKNRDLERRRLAGLANRKPGPTFDCRKYLPADWRGPRGPKANLT